MVKEELLELYVELQITESVKEMTKLFLKIHEVLNQISRKRELFVEDAYSTIYKRVQSFVKPRFNSEYDENIKSTIADTNVIYISDIEAITICLDFNLAFPISTEALYSTMLKENYLHIAYLLYLLGENLFTQDIEAVREIRTNIIQRLFQYIEMTGISFQTILATPRLREALQEYASVLFPNGIDSEMDSTDDILEDKFEDDCDSDEEDDELWIFQQIAPLFSWPISMQRHVMEIKSYTPDYIQWSKAGLETFLTQAFLSDTISSKKFIALITPQMMLYYITAVAQELLRESSLDKRKEALLLLQQCFIYCPKESIPYNCSVDSLDTSCPSFTDYATKVCGNKKNYIMPLVQVLTNAMVTFPDAKDRALAYSTLNELISCLPISRGRFDFLRQCCLNCPYGNVTAIFLDSLRQNCIKLWTTQLDNAFCSPAITTLVIAVLEQIIQDEKSIGMFGDAIASALSIIRFLYIRDFKERNQTGIHRKESITSLKNILYQLRKLVDRLPDDEKLRFLVLDAAVDATFECICSKNE